MLMKEKPNRKKEEKTMLDTCIATMHNAREDFYNK